MQITRFFIGKLIPILLFSFFVLKPARMQENLPSPIDPALVFPSSDHVTVVETLPLYVANQKQVSFYDYNSQEWHTNPYPDFPLLPGEIAIADFTESTDGSYTLKVDYYTACTDCEIDESYIDFTPPHAAFVRERWHFFPRTGVFTPFSAICGEHAQAGNGEGEWVVTSLDGEVYLCNTATGQTSAALPNIGSISIPSLLRHPSISPDNRWLVFTFYYDLLIWAYDFVEGKLNLLGTMTTTSPFTSIDYPNFSWIDDQRVVVENFTVNYGDDNFYLYGANVSRPDSLKLFYHNDYELTLNLDQPSCTVWIDQQFDATSNIITPSLPEACLLTKHDSTDNTFFPSSPDGRFRLIVSNHGTLDIRNVETHEITTIAQVPEGAKIYGVWEGNGLITITVWKDDSYQEKLGRWRLRVSPK